jgi:hypothetical protein
MELPTESLDPPTEFTDDAGNVRYAYHVENLVIYVDADGLIVAVDDTLVA